MFLRYIIYDCTIRHVEVTRLWLHLGLKIATFENKYHASYEYTSLKESLFSQCRRSLKWLFSPRGQHLRVRLNKTKNDLPNWLSTETKEWSFLTSVMFLRTPRFKFFCLSWTYWNTFRWHTMTHKVQLSSK